MRRNTFVRCPIKELFCTSLLCLSTSYDFFVFCLSVMNFCTFHDNALTSMSLNVITALTNLPRLLLATEGLLPFERWQWRLVLLTDWDFQTVFEQSWYVKQDISIYCVTNVNLCHNIWRNVTQNQWHCTSHSEICGEVFAIYFFTISTE